MGEAPLSEVFDDVVEFPNDVAKVRLNRLVGLDHIQSDLAEEAAVLLDRETIGRWSEKAYGKSIPLIEVFSDRHVLFIFEGDVGAGKTALAESIGDRIARENKISVSLFKLSLNARGAGAVGEMTRLISAAFREVRDHVTPTEEGGSGRSAILLIDEADALAQSRELSQMHHEDRAGVNALIRGLDTLAAIGASSIVLLVTNRLDSLDPAVRRRASRIFPFSRPNDDQRTEILRLYLRDSGLDDRQIGEIVDLTGPTEDAIGCTYSDIVQRLLPQFVFSALPDRRIKFDRIRAIAADFEPTPSFKNQSS